MAVWSCCFYEDNEVIGKNYIERQWYQQIICKANFLPPFRAAVAFFVCKAILDLDIEKEHSFKNEYRETNRI